MLQFACDSCLRTKETGEAWILGLAADTLGAISTSREVTILQIWDPDRAVDPLAVHFCSANCKNRYLDQLFAETPAPRVRARRKTAKPAARSKSRSRNRGAKKAA